MALFRTGSGGVKEQVILAGVFNTTRMEGDYSGNNGVTVDCYSADITSADAHKVISHNDVINSNSSAPFYSYHSGNQGGKVYYDNGKIVYELTQSNGLIALFVYATI